MKFLSLKKYLHETSLHGCGNVDNKNKFITVFWVALIVLCACFCVRDICSLVRNYQLVPTLLSLNVIPNLNAELTTPTLCMEIMVAPPEGNDFTTEDINGEINAFMSATGNGTNLKVNNTDMQLTDRLEYLTYLMLAYITDFELSYMGEQKIMHTEYVTKYPTPPDVLSINFNNPTASSFQHFIQPVYETYMAYKVSLNSLKRLVGMHICHKQIQLALNGSRLGDTSGTTLPSMCSADTISHLSFSLMCVKLFNTSTYTVTDGLTISLRGLLSASKDPFPPLARTRRCQESLATDNYIPVDFLWHVDLQGRPVLPEAPVADTFSLDPAFAASKYDITVYAEFDFYNVPTIRSRTCSSIARQHDCIRQKKAERISQSCNCWPSTILGVDNVKKMPGCSDNLSRINPNVLSNVTYFQCVAIADANVVGLCDPDCKSYLFHVDTVDAAQTWGFDSVFTPNLDFPMYLGSAEISFQSTSVRSYIFESPSMTFTTFACTFGGILGTYLGGSILALIHIPIFWIAQLTNSLTRRKKVESVKADAKVQNMDKHQIYPPVATVV